MRRRVIFAWLAISCLPALQAAEVWQQAASGQSVAVEKWTVTVGKSLVIDSPLPVERISVADGGLADAVAIGPKEVLINGKAPGETTLIVWQRGGARLIYDLSVRISPLKLEAARMQIAREFPDDDISLTFDNNAPFIRGSVKDVVAAQRVVAIASTLGKPVNLLRVEVPPVEAQVLVKVRFANVDRSASSELGAAFATGAFNQDTSINVGKPISTDGGRTLSLSDAMNFLVLRPDINLAVAIKALQSRNLLEMLAEPSVPAINGKAASFVSGGEFPFPMVQPGQGGSSVTLSWREWGVRLNFLPVVTPRGTIRLQVNPEVSSLDYTRAVSLQGFTVPGLSTRRVKTELELESGQSFVIAGLIDNQTSESMQKIPGISAIPILGKLFQSKTISHNNGELLVIVTPEIVRPIPAGQHVPELNLPRQFMDNNTKEPLRQPGLDKTGDAPATGPVKTVPVEQLLDLMKQGTPEAAPNAPTGVPQAAQPAGPAGAAPPVSPGGGE